MRKRVKSKDKPLSCGVEGDQLVIRIGVSTLTFATRPKNGGILEDCYVSNEHQFAKDVANEMMHDAGEGPFPFPDFLDDMIKAAADSGSSGLTYPKRKFRRERKP